MMRLRVALEGRDDWLNIADFWTLDYAIEVALDLFLQEGVTSVGIWKARPMRVIWWLDRECLHPETGQRPDFP